MRRELLSKGVLHLLLLALMCGITFASAQALAICGDGILELTEQCDDGNNAPGDGCSPACTEEAGFMCNTISQCGNGMLDFGEQCDDGNTIPGDGCDNCATETDLSTFTAETFPFAISSLVTPVWNVSADKKSVTLPNINPKPGFFYSPDEVLGADTSRVIDFKFSGASDEDYVGFVFGYEPGDVTSATADYVLIAWKDQFQSNNFSGNPIDDACAGGDATTGLSMIRVQGATAGDELWNRADCPNQGALITPLATSTNYANTGYAPAYPDVKVVYTATRIQVYVDNVLDMDVLGNFPVTGRYGLYQFAQQGITFNVLGANSQTSGCQAVCGDGLVVGSEQCDDGNTDPNDGCDSLCGEEQGYACTNLPVLPSICVSTCGDGVRANNEQCDDNNLLPGDGCSPLCTIEPGFDCTGDTPSTCTTECGDGILAGTEQCDDDNTTAQDGCSATCMTETGYSCTSIPFATSVCTSVCGDSTVAVGTEQCDDGNIAPADGCSTTCQTEADFTCPTQGGQCLTVMLTSPADNAQVSADPSYSGTSTPGATVTVTVTDQGNNQVFSTTVTADALTGAWTLAPQGLTEGSYTVSASVTTSGGTYTDSHSFTLDTTAPVVMLSSPSGTITDSTPTIMGMVDDADASVMVTLSPQPGTLGGPQLLTATVDSSGNWSVDAAMLPDGSYDIAVTATDDAGNQGTTSGSFTLDASAPMPTIIAPADGTTTSDVRPDFSGTSEPGSMVALTLTDAGGNTVHTSTVMADPLTGSWTVSDLSQDLTDGAYTVSVTATDAAGNSGMASSTFTIDSAAPSVSVTGPSGLINDNTPTIMGTVDDPSATVTVLITPVAGTAGNPQTLLATVDASGDWSVDAALLADGSYTIQATATDSNLNSSMASGSFTLDATAPLPVITSPLSGTTTSDSSPDISGTSEPGSTVVLTLTDASGATVHTATVTADAVTGAFIVDDVPAGLASGTYTASVTATDAAGNSGMASNTFTINSAAPSVSVSGPMGEIADNTPTITGLVNDPAATVTVVVTPDRPNQGAPRTFMASVDSSGSWSVDSSMLPDGGYTIQATATNASGNSSTASGSFSIDSTNPIVAVTSPANGSTTSDVRPDVTGTSEPGSSVVVTITDDMGNLVHTATVTADAVTGAFIVDDLMDDLISGQAYTVSVVATDGAGNMGSTMTEFTVDTSAPMIAIDSPTQGEVLDVASPAVSGVSDPGATVTVVVRDANDDIVDVVTVIADANGFWSAALDALGDGEYTASATTTNAAGITATDAVMFVVDAMMGGARAAIAITSPGNQSLLTEGMPEVTGVADLDAALVVTFTNAQGDVIATAMAMVEPDGTWSATPDQDLPDGIYTIEATATRPDGSSASDRVTVIVDAQEPAIVITSPADGMITNITQPVLQGTTEPRARVTVTVTDEAGAVVFMGEVRADPDGSWSIPVSAPLAEGTYTVDAQAVDRVGNTSSAQSVDFTVDSTSPGVTLDTPVAGTRTDDTTPTLSGTTVPGGTVEIFVDGEKVGEVVADEDGDWTYDVEAELEPGKHYFEATATDDAGNESSSGKVPVSIDGGPAPTITSPADGAQVTGPDVTVTGTGTPGDEVTVRLNGSRETVTVGEDGTFEVTLSSVPPGANKTLSVTSSDGARSEIQVTVLPGADVGQDTDLILVGGGGCSSAPGAPVSPLAGLLMLLGMFGLWRRQRR